MNTMNEDFLTAWLRLSTSINNPRIVSELTYNESLICNILYNHLRSESDTPLTATDLCSATKMLKSQMNRTLNALENKNLITKERSSSDKRLVYITMNIDQANLYRKQHEQILKIIDAAIQKLGKDKALKTIEIFNSISELADNLNLG